MKPEDLPVNVKAYLADLQQLQKEQLPKIIGVEAVNHYTESFVNEGFEDKEVKKWPDVKRRNPESEWYGFSYRSNSAKPGAKTPLSSGRGAGGEVKKGFTNFSPEATKNKILTGSTSELKNSIHYVVKSDRVTVGTDKPYAAVHQFGLQAKVFGKAAFTMKARPFIGNSQVLNETILNKVQREITKLKEKHNIQ